MGWRDSRARFSTREPKTAGQPPQGHNLAFTIAETTGYPEPQSPAVNEVACEH